MASNMSRDSITFPSPAANSSVGAAAPKRTLAILTKSAARVHRLAIQTRIIDAGFKILAGRSHQWSLPEDEQFLSQLLDQEIRTVGRDRALSRWIPRLTQGLNYILVLERINPSATWHNLLGSDTANAQDDPFELDQNGFPIVKIGLRKTYGDDAFYGSPNDAAAEQQISLCFPELSVSMLPSPVPANESKNSPNLPALECAIDSLNLSEQAISENENTEQQHQDHQLASAKQQDDVQQPIYDIHPSHTLSPPQTLNHEQTNAFRARPVPNTTHKPSIEPRLSLAAALRMGVELPESPRRRNLSSDNGSASSARDKLGPVGISGLPKVQVPLPISLRPPTIAPRLNKATTARNNPDPFAENVSKPIRERKEVDFSNTPGHKRKTSIVVSSMAAPAIPPRQNRASLSRMHSGGVPLSVRDPSSSPMMVRAFSVQSMEGLSPSGSRPKTADRERKPVDFSHTPGHKRQSLSLSIPSLAAPTMTPRTNRASMSRMGSADKPSSTTVTGMNPIGRKRNDDNVPFANGSIAEKPHRRPPTRPSTAGSLFANTPGHKRQSMGFHLPSLQTPTIVPRSNTAAMARTAAIAANVLDTGKLKPKRPFTATGSIPSSPLTCSTFANTHPTHV